eukprot:TRINITY_DN24565_c0_g1_i1.p1 TRINITY_DN24565_c0_g1~~TRINITY_DN24565_c0_g1_i1.p1  ORF type:complete len:989 (-),score=264.83 TRINITY_DN24565_c0_g1_i1:182-3148(-)
MRPMQQTHSGRMAPTVSTAGVKNVSAKVPMGIGVSKVDMASPQTCKIIFEMLDEKGFHVLNRGDARAFLRCLGWANTDEELDRVLDSVQFGAGRTDKKNCSWTMKQMLYLAETLNQNFTNIYPDQLRQACETMSASGRVNGDFIWRFAKGQMGEMTEADVRLLMEALMKAPSAAERAKDPRAVAGTLEDDEWLGGPFSAALLEHVCQPPSFLDLKKCENFKGVEQILHAKKPTVPGLRPERGGAKNDAETTEYLVLNNVLADKKTQDMRNSKQNPIRLAAKFSEEERQLSLAAQRPPSPASSARSSKAMRGSTLPESDKEEEPSPRVQAMTRRRVNRQPKKTGREAPPPEACQFRFIVIGDVHELTTLAHVATCKREYCSSSQADRHCKLVVTGNFLSASLLSSLDKGRSMVALLNKIGVDYVILGNHDANLSIDQLRSRLEDATFKCLVSNLTAIAFDAKKCPDSVILPAKSLEGAHTREIGLVGLTSDDERLYSKMSWSCMDSLDPEMGQGAAVVGSVLDTATKMQKNMMNKGYDVVVPITHQPIEQDRDLARQMKNTPVIIGGFDEEEFVEVCNGVQIVKMGMDAQRIGVVDLTWTNKEVEGAKPNVSVMTFDYTDFAPDEDVLELANSQLAILSHLHTTELLRYPEGPLLTTDNCRSRQCSMGSFMCNEARAALKTDCCLINASAFKTITFYKSEKQMLTFRDFENILIFDTDMAILQLPGQVISDTVEYSRKFATEETMHGKLPGCYLQVDDGITYDFRKHVVSHIAGKAIKPDEMYEVALLWDAVLGTDDLEPLVKYLKNNPHVMPPGINATRRLNEVLLVKYATRFMFSLFLNFCDHFAAIDTDHDGKLNMKEMRSYLSKTVGDGIRDVMIEEIFMPADANKDRTISGTEFMRICVTALHSSGELTTIASYQNFTKYAQKTLGQAFIASPIEHLFREIAGNLETEMTPEIVETWLETMRPKHSTLQADEETSIGDRNTKPK